MLVDRSGAVAVVRLNRPEAMNAVDHRLAVALGAAFAELDADAGARCIVRTGIGRAFCAGMDLKAFARGEGPDTPGHPDWGFGGVPGQQIDTPVIAAVNGPALGGWLELALACDLIVADAAAMFGLPEVTRGLFAAAGGVQRLAQRIPPSAAAGLVLTGRRFSADEAKRWGLVNRVAPQGTALDVAVDLAEAIASNAPLAVRTTKRLLRASASGSSWAPAVWDRNDEAVWVVFASADAREGAAAFAEKRPPTWTGR